MAGGGRGPSLTSQRVVCDEPGDQQPRGEQQTMGGHASQGLGLGTKGNRGVEAEASHDKTDCTERTF